MISFRDWIFSKYPPDSKINGAWGALHILTLIAVISSIVALTLIFRNKSCKAKRTVMFVIAGTLLFFELSRRTIGFASGNELNFTGVLYLLLPRPWCAISVWLFISSTLIKKIFLRNFTSISSVLCAVIFFSYPSVGFNDKYILFENLYSICTHSLLLIGAVLLITLKFTDFDIKSGVWKEGITFAAVIIYALIEIFVLKIENDPLFFMPENEVQVIVGLNYPVYLVLYIVFLTVFFSSFYAVTYFAAKRKAVEIQL